MKIAITGATGFVGTHLIRKLKERGFSFISFDRSKHDLFQVETLKSLLSGKDVVIHLAGANKDSSFKEMIKVNVLGTKSLLKAMRCYCPQAKIIFASSFMVYRKNDVFGTTKKLAEELIEDDVQRFSLKAIILRLTNLYGPGGKPFRNSVIATFIHQIKTRRPITINGDGSQRRDYLHVQDAVAAMIKSISYQPKKVEYFDLCSGKLTSLNEIVFLLEKYSPLKIKVKYNKMVKSDDFNLKKSCAKARKLLKWKSKISLDDGLKLLMEA